MSNKIVLMETEEQEKNNNNFQSVVYKLYDRLRCPTYLKRFIFFFSCDYLLIAISLYLSFWIRFEFTMSIQYYLILLNVLPLFVFVKLAIFSCFKVYKITWRYCTLSDLANIAFALMLSVLLLYSLIYMGSCSFHSSLISRILSKVNINVNGFPRSVFFIDGIISFFLLCSLRVSKRLFLESFYKIKYTHRGKKTILIGAGSTGEMILRDLRRRGFMEFFPIGLLDDNRNMVDTNINGVKVLGAINMLSSIISKYDVEAIIITIPSLNHKTLREICSLAKNKKVDTIKIVPRIYNFHKPDLKTNDLEDIKIEDLVGRQMVEIDSLGIEAFLKNKVILVTGAGGSIGSEIILQVCSFQPRKVILFDVDETELHNMKIKIEKIFPGLFDCQSANSRFQDKVVFITGDIRDEKVVTEVIKKFKPQIVFHAAAYKHVPMMEINSSEAVKVNILGTYRVVKASAENHVEKFIMISTDKAVRPTSIMGATKRMAEYICSAFNECGSTGFISVRFGNVLGSRGSVLPLFLDQLKHGGPLTITHKDIERFFMTIPEAVSLVLQASTLGNGGEVFVLDMGEPVKIVKFAEELIKIHGLKPYTDIDIKFTGLRPGEKLFEEMLTEEEGTTATKNKKIFVAKNSDKYSRDEIEKIIQCLEKIVKLLPVTEDYEIIRDILKIYVKSFERRQQEGIRQKSDAKIGIKVSRTHETDFCLFQRRFEELMRMLPTLENCEIINDTLESYVKSLTRRRREIECLGN